MGAVELKKVVDSYRAHNDAEAKRLGIDETGPKLAAATERLHHAARVVGAQHWAVPGLARGTHEAHLQQFIGAALDFVAAERADEAARAKRQFDAVPPKAAARP